jgi:hypothetical protein
VLAPTALFAVSSSSADASPTPAPPPTVTTAYPTPAWWDSARAVRVGAHSLNAGIEACIADAQILPEGMAISKSFPGRGIPATLVPWQQVDYVQAAADDEATANGCP